MKKEIEAYIAQGYFYCRPMPENEFEDRLDLLTEKKNNIDKQKENIL